MAKRKNRSSRQLRRTQHPLAQQVRRAGKPVSAVKSAETLVSPSPDWWTYRFLPGLILFVAALIYAYLPTLQWITDAWQREPDYSHGFLVVPLAALILYRRWEWFPGLRQRPSYAALSLILLAIAMRITGRLVFADFMDGWSMVPLIAGVVWFLWGWAAMKWAFPAILFLLFMIPLPFQLESTLSWQLQGVATKMSAAMLLILGQPAVSEGHIVWLQDDPLMIEQACSGLRIFVGVVALAYFWAAVSNRHWIDRVVIMLAAVPLAMIANSMRITLIGLLYQWFESPSVRHHLHDLTGFAMIPLAFAMLWLVKSYWEQLYRPVKALSVKDLLKTSAVVSR